MLTFHDEVSHEVGTCQTQISWRCCDVGYCIRIGNKQLVGSIFRASEASIEGSDVEWDGCSGRGLDDVGDGHEVLRYGVTHNALLSLLVHFFKMWPQVVTTSLYLQ